MHVLTSSLEGLATEAWLLGGLGVPGLGSRQLLGGPGRGISK